jgi:hypothetical protein
MGLKKLAPGQKRSETPTATWDELLAFREAAVKLGYASLATAALTAWEWLQREEHLFGAFEISHYRPKARPNSVGVVHPKTGEEAWWPLFDETGKELFPELMPELDAIKEQTVGAAELRDELSFTSFRHGGFTEGADSDLSDAEPRAAGRHRSARQLPTYAKRTRKQLITGVQKRRAERTKPAGLSE